MRSKHLNTRQISSAVLFHQPNLPEIGSAWSELLHEHLGPLQGTRILDAGCGGGFLALLLAQAGCQVTALDHSEAILQKARNQARLLGLEDRITFCQADASDTALESESFDAVVSRHASSLFMHPYSAYQEWHRLLKPRGTVLNFDANWLSPLWDDTLSKAFLEDEEKVRRKAADYSDIYQDRFALMQLSQYPLSFRRRPQWDQEACSAIGFREIHTSFLPDEGLRDPIIRQRFRLIPTFLVRASK